MLDKVLDIIERACRVVVFVAAVINWWTGDTGTATFCMLVLIWDVLWDINRGTNIEVHFKD